MASQQFRRFVLDLGQSTHSVHIALDRGINFTFLHHIKACKCKVLIIIQTMDILFIEKIIKHTCLSVIIIVNTTGPNTEIV